MSKVEDYLRNPDELDRRWFNAFMSDDLEEMVEIQKIRLQNLIKILEEKFGDTSDKHFIIFTKEEFKKIEIKPQEYIVMDDSQLRLKYLERKKTLSIVSTERSET